VEVVEVVVVVVVVVEVATAPLPTNPPAPVRAALKETVGLSFAKERGVGRVSGMVGGTETGTVRGTGVWMGSRVLLRGSRVSVGLRRSAGGGTGPVDAIALALVAVAVVVVAVVVVEEGVGGVGI